jgi:hypothetical protein
MLDFHTGKPVRVRDEYPPLPYLMVRHKQVEAVKALLDANGFSYEVEPNIISVNGAPGVMFINLKRGTDARAVQEVLDRAE